MKQEKETATRITNESMIQLIHNKDVKITARITNESIQLIMVEKYQKKKIRRPASTLNL